MDLLIICIAVILFLGSVLGSIAGNIVESELYDCAPSFARWLERIQQKWKLVLRPNAL